MENERRYRGNSRAIRERKRRQRIRRIRNRTIIIACFVLILALIIWVFSSCIKGCSKGCASKNTAGISTETKSTEATEKPKSENESKSDANSHEEFPTEADDMSFNKPKIDDDGSAGAYEGNLYIWNDSAFEMFYGDKDLAEAYANLINTAHSSLGDGINLYSMIVPNHTEFGLPDRLKSDGNATTYSQADYIKNAYSAMNDGATPVNVYNALSKHCNEYIYFSSDHHWTGLGAYYAYAAFMEQLDKIPLSLDDCTENTIDGFTGSFLKLVSGGVKDDTVHFWSFPYDAPTSVTDDSGSTADYDSPFYEYASSGDYTYSLFLYGDNPLTCIQSSSENADDEKILVVHESYGNALIPFLSNNYSEVYSIDFRSWEGSIKDFCEENDITNVLFLNGVMSSATTMQVDAMESIL